MTPTFTQTKDDCCGCKACANVCPQNAITFLPDEYGKGKRGFLSIAYQYKQRYGGIHHSWQLPFTDQVKGEAREEVGYGYDSQ